MAVLTRITDFIPNTLIESQEVDDEFNQLVNLLSGVSTNKDTLLRYNHATDPVLRVDQLGAGLIQQWLNNGTARASLSALGKLLLPAGIGATPSTDQISNFGVYFFDGSIRSTAADTNETDFSSKTSAANVFGNDGDFIIYLAGVNFAANANTKRYRIYFGSTTLIDTGAVAFNNVNALVVGYAYRRTSTVITGVGATILPGGTNLNTFLTDAGAQNFATTNVIKSTGLNGTASDDDIEQFGFMLLKGSV
jgi:hypothetical protein